MDKKIPHKPRRMIDYLREKINSGQFAEGTKIPPLRELMAQFDLSYGSVKRGIDYLHEIGLVSKHPGRGTYIQTRKLSRVGKNIIRIAVFINNLNADNRPGIYPTVLLGIQQMAELNGCSLILNYLDRANATTKKIAEMSSGADGMILLAEYDYRIKKFPTHIPGVGVCMHKPMSGAVSIVDMDPFSIAALASKYFRKRKKRKVIFIFSDFPAYKNRGEVFAMEWERGEGAVEFIHCQEKIKFRKKYGYLFATGSTLQEFSIKYENEFGKRLTDSMTILGVDGKHLLDPTFHPVPAITIDWKNVGKSAFEECLSRIRHPGKIPGRIYFPGKII